MVKSIIYTIAAIALCAGLFVFCEIYVNSQFDDFEGAVQTLYEKTENKTANREDGYAVKSMWEDKKRKLQVFLPHNDISYVDYWLSEACGLIYSGEYDEALSKVEVLREIAGNLPKAYGVSWENVF